MARLARRVVWPSLLALLVCCSVCWAAAGSALADELPEPFTVPTENWTEPLELPAPEGCPEGVEEAYEGEEAMARQITLLRGELQHECKAEADRLDQAISRLWWVTVEQLESGRDSHAWRVEQNENHEHDEATYETLIELLREMKGPVSQLGTYGFLREALIGSEEAHPFPVSGEGGAGGGLTSVDLEAQTAELTSSSQAVGEGTKVALWIIAGMILGCCAFYAFWKLTVGRD